MKKISVLPALRFSTACALGLMTCVVSAQPLVNIDTVTVGDQGNAADITGYGAVANIFAIGKYEVTITQYTTFLNSVASVTSDSYIADLWNANMTSDLNIAGISRSGDGTLASPYSYSVIGSGNRPIAYVSWFDAARFANWMDNGASSGASTETGAYTLNGSTSGIIAKNAEATWWIPSADEWYKAAYYKGGGTNAGYWTYPTQSDDTPDNSIGGSTNQANYFAGDFSVTQSSSYDATQNYLTEIGAFSNSPSAYQTYDQAGNLWEWNDSTDGSNSTSLRGGSWGGNGAAGDGSPDLRSTAGGPLSPEGEGPDIGFRVATVPEPTTYALLLLSGAASLWVLKRRKS